MFVDAVELVIKSFVLLKPDLTVPSMVSVDDVIKLFVVCPVLVIKLFVVCPVVVIKLFVASPVLEIKLLVVPKALFTVLLLAVIVSVGTPTDEGEMLLGFIEDGDGFSNGLTAVLTNPLPPPVTAFSAAFVILDPVDPIITLEQKFIICQCFKKILYPS